MQRHRSVTLAPAAAAANNIATSQTPAAGGVQALTINGALASGGVATMDIARRVGITSAGADTARSFVITGTDRFGRDQSETLAGPGAAATVTSLKDYKTVTGITVDANTAGAITVGTTGKVSSQWFPVDRVGMQSLGIGMRVTGTANYTIEHTYQNVFTAGKGVLPPGGVPDTYYEPYAHPSLDSKTGNIFGSYEDSNIAAVRLTLNSFTAPGSVTADFSPGFAR